VHCVRRSRQRHRGVVQTCPTEYQVWFVVLKEKETNDRVEPSDEAIKAAFVSAQEIDAEAATFQNSWPDGLEPRDGPDLIRPADPRLQIRPGFSRARALELSVNGLATSGLSVGTNFVGHPSLTAFTQIMTAMNQYPRVESLVSLYLAPLLRRYLDPDPTPAWYFRHVARMRSLRARRPLLLPAGSPSMLERLPAGFGWDRYEFWCLTAYLAEHKYIERNPSNARLSLTRLSALAKHAANRMTELAETTGDRATRICDFDDLCAPLRRFLLHVVADPVAEGQVRQECSAHLKALRGASEIKLPKIRAEYVPYYYPWLYERNLELLRPIWRDTRGTRDPGLRKRRIENEFLAFPIAPNDRGWNGKLARFWRNCGDLRRIQAGDMAHRLTAFVLGLELTPQRLREVVPKLHHRSTSRQEGSPQTPPIPILPIEFV